MDKGASSTDRHVRRTGPGSEIIELNAYFRRRAAASAKNPANPEKPPGRVDRPTDDDDPGPAAA